MNSFHIHYTNTVPIRVIENDQIFHFFRLIKYEVFFLLISQPNIKVRKQVKKEKPKLKKKKKKEQVHGDKCYVVLKLTCPSLHLHSWPKYLLPTICRMLKHGAKIILNRNLLNEHHSP